MIYCADRQSTPADGGETIGGGFLFARALRCASEGGNMKHILIIYTGGTIGMVRTPNGYAPRDGYFRKALDAIPPLASAEMPRWELLELSPLLDSSNMTVNEWNKIAHIIADNYDSYDGFVVLHGTDTMAYTASALSFMLEGLAKPVVLTGSQIPLCELRSDGRDNIITSVLIAAGERVREVCLYFGGSLLRGNRATKYSADGLIAFVSPNYPPLAEAGITIRYNDAALLPGQTGGLHLQTLENVPIGVIKVFPGIQAAVVTIRTKDGEYTDRVDFPKGEPENPLTDEEFRTRYDGLMAYAGVDAAVSSAVFDAVNAENEPVEKLVIDL